MVLIFLGLKNSKICIFRRKTMVFTFSGIKNPEAWAFGFPKILELTIRHETMGFIFVVFKNLNFSTSNGGSYLFGTQKL